jgi:plastocyanin
MSKGRRRLAAIIALASLLILVGGQFSSAGSRFVVRGREVAPFDFKWKPKLAEVTPGTRVIWRAVDGNHTVTSYGGGWSKNTAIAEGERTRFRFNNNGTFKYFCTIHGNVVDGVCSAMCGKVRVS